MQKLFKFFNQNYLFILIVFLAAALRFYGTAQYPPSLNWDEISHGYNAYSILKTGKDEWGFIFPTIFRAYGDFKLPAYIYLTSIFELFLGLTPLAVRIVSILSGIGTVVFSYLLVKKIFNQRVAILVSFLVSVEPWTFFLSRGAFEANLAVFFIVAGIYFFIKLEDNLKYLIPSFILLGISVWTYNSARIFVPLLLIVLVLIYKEKLALLIKKDKKLLILNTLILVIFFIPMFFQLLNTSGQARYEKIAIIDEGAIAKINQDRNSSKLHPVISRLIHNKVSYFSAIFIKNYFSYFSPEFLFFKGGSQYQFSVPNHGLIYLINIPFFIFGLIFLFKKRTKGSLLIISWLLLSPIAGSITREAPHVLRAITMIPLPMIISAYGFINFYDWIKNKNFKVVILAIYLILLLACIENYLTLYFMDYPKKYSWSWQYGYKNIIDYVKQNSFLYEKIIVTKKYGEPHEFFLFFMQYNPTKYLSDKTAIKFFQSDWYWIDKFDKYYFVNDWQIKDLVTESKISIDCKKIKCLLITSPNNYPLGWKKLETINFLDNSPAFEIYENH